MNLSRIVSTLIKQFGVYVIALPFKNEITGEPQPPEIIIKDILKTVTIPVYSQYQPWIRTGSIDISKMKVVDKRQSIYELPSYLLTTPIMYIQSIHMPQMNTRGTYGDISPAYGINRSVTGVISSMGYMMLAGQMRAEPSFEFISPNKVRLFGYPKTVVTIELACEHESNGETIPAGCYQSFLELATLDMKEFLYNNLKHWDKIPSAFGVNDLKIDEFQSASSDKKALLDQWNDVFHLDADNWVFM